MYNKNYDGPQKIINIKNDNYKNEWHNTWNGKRYYLRSSYETQFANILDEKQIDYEVERIRVPYFDTAKKTKRIAVSDFYIPDENLIIEIKSLHTFEKQNMIDRTKEYIKQGYKFKLLMDFDGEGNFIEYEYKDLFNLDKDKLKEEYKEYARMRKQKGIKI